MKKKERNLLYLVAALCLIALIVCTSTMQPSQLIIGKNTESTGYFYIEDDQKVVVLYSTSGETVDVMYARIQYLFDLGSLYIRGVIYSSDGTFLTQTNDVQVTSEYADFTWVELPLNSPVTLSTGSYYLGIHVGTYGGLNIGYEGTETLVGTYVQDLYSDGTSVDLNADEEIYPVWGYIDIYATVAGAPVPTPTPTPTPAPTSAPSPSPSTIGTLNITTFNLGEEISCSVQTELSPDHYRNDWTPVTIQLEAGSYNLVATYAEQTLTDTVIIEVDQTTDIIFHFEVAGPTPSPSPTPSPTPVEPFSLSKEILFVVVIAIVATTLILLAKLRKKKST